MLNRFLMLLLLLPLPVAAETAKSSYVPPPAVVSADSLLQTMGGLLLVLAIIGGGAWLLKRFSLIPTTAGGTIKVVAASGVGQRERVVVVEINDTWLVLGVAPGRVNRLHAMEKPATPAAPVTENPSAGAFAEQLTQSINKDHAK